MQTALKPIALHQIKALKQRNEDYYAEREANYRLPVRERSFDWQSYCRHGSYIGDPYGGDYLCGACEEGLSLYEEAVAVVRQAEHEYEEILSLIPALQKVQRLGGVEDGFDVMQAMIEKWKQRWTR